MKKIATKLLFSLLLLSSISCTKEKLSDSIIDTNKPFLNETDQWIRTNYTNPYNIEVIYKWNDGETTIGKNLIPPKEEMVKPIMKMLDSVWIQSYIKEGGLAFFKKLTPKQFLLIGSPSYNSDGSRTQGTAEGGRKIVLYAVDWYNPANKALIWEEYIHVIFHEFGHIMHQTINYDPDYKNTISGYTAAWTDFSDTQAREKGFITAYSLSGPDEDFVEVLSIFVTTSPASWDVTISAIQNPAAKAALIAKLDKVKTYMNSAWNIDIYSLRTTVNEAIDRVVTNTK
ncbi:MAG: putative zinc-binding metallopeptidase [Bacteroidales bacterium]|nr:putative zinc-binding metallopeptidase [Bacteroidales bacterium]